MDIKQMTAYILAGGGSRRMGRDKLFAEFSNTTLIENTVQICSDQFQVVKIVAKDAEKFKPLSTPVLIDSILADGPMAGIITALEDCPDEYCFITAADFYDLNNDLVNKITDSYNGEQFLGLKINDRYQPLCGIYHLSCLDKLKIIAQTKNYKMIDALTQFEDRYLELTLDNWRNINSPKDFEAIRSEHV